MTREEIFRAALESGLQRVKSCCGVDGKLCAGDEWTGNLDGFVAEILRRERRRLACVAGGMTGPGNTPEQAQGYSDACRDIRAAILRDN